MDLKCKLLEKSFKDADGKSHAYNVIAFELIDGSTLEITVKGDKAKLLRLSNNVNKTEKNDFWSE